MPIKLLLLATLGMIAWADSALAQRLTLEKIKLPPGFSIEVFTDSLPNARSMAWGAKGTLFVGTRSGGRVYAVRHDGRKATRVFTIASGLNMPNGVAFHAETLYVAEVDRILRFDNIETRLDNPPAAVLVTDRFPREGHHGWKFIRIGPDGWLYVPVGAPCNVCAPSDRHALIARIRLDGSGYEVVARGVRNSVGFDWNPEDNSLWFTDNGRDMMGDELPSDELNHAPKVGLHFGFPYCHQGDLPDPEYGARRACREFTPPQANLGPHVAALGMRFYNGSQFPLEYRNSIFIAEHGSWNRSKKIGYRIKRITLAGGKVLAQEVFAEGWLQGESVSGRPVDIETLPDGSLLVSDDYAGAIYRISYARP